MFFRALRRALSRLRKRKKHNPTAERCEETIPREKEVDPSHQRTNNKRSLLFREVPPPIIMEILSRLPVRDVICARCVSKTWSELIADPYFAKLHLARAPPSYTSIANCDKIPRISRFLLADVEREESRGYFVRVKHLNPRFTLPGVNLELKTSCNGLLCIEVPKANNGDVVYVCNPLLGEYTILPEIGYKRYKRFILGFGFTSSCCSNYKVLQGVYDLNSINYVLQVHKLGTRTWQRLEDIPNWICKKWRPGTFLNGSLHWFSRSADAHHPYRFCSFDLQSEQFKPFPGPSFHLGMPCQAFLRVSGSLMCFLLVKPSSRSLDLWVMKEYGVKESWTRVNTILFWNPLAVRSSWMQQDFHLLDYGSRGGGDELRKDVCNTHRHVQL